MKSNKDILQKMYQIVTNYNNGILDVFGGRLKYINILYIEIIFLSYVVYYGINKIFNNTFDMGTLIVLYSVVGFILLVFNTKHSYFGSFVMSTSLLTLIFLSIYGITFELEYVKWVEILIIYTFSFILIYLGHYISHNKDWTLLKKMPKSKFTYPFVLYMLTLLFMATFYLRDNIPNKTYVFISVILLAYILGLNIVNHCQREHRIQSLIDISNKKYYSQLLNTFKKRYILYESQNEVIISEFINSINYFIEGTYENSILSSYAAIEAFERVIGWSYNIKLRESKFGSRRRLIANWRNYIAHSNVEEEYVRDDGYLISYYLRAFHSILHTYDILTLSYVSSFVLDL